MRFLLQQGAIEANSSLLMEVFTVRQPAVKDLLNEEDFEQSFLEDLMVQVLGKLSNAQSDLKNMARYIVKGYLRATACQTGSVTPTAPQINEDLVDV